MFPFVRKNTSILLILLLIFTIKGIGQSDITIKLDAKLTSVDELGAKLSVVKVVLWEDGQPSDSIITQNGRAFFDLDTGHVYKVYFTKSGYVGKHLLINTRQAPWEIKKKINLKVDVGLFKAKDGLIVDFLENQPIGIANFNFVSEELEWNTEYTRLIVDKIIEATLEYTSQKEKKKANSSTQPKDSIP